MLAIGKSFEQQGRLENARQVYQQILAQHPHSIFARQRLEILTANAYRQTMPQATVAAKSLEAGNQNVFVGSQPEDQLTGSLRKTSRAQVSSNIESMDVSQIPPSPYQFSRDLNADEVQFSTSTEPNVVHTDGNDGIINYAGVEWELPVLHSKAVDSSSNSTLEFDGVDGPAPTSDLRSANEQPEILLIPKDYAPNSVDRVQGLAHTLNQKFEKSQLKMLNYEVMAVAPSLNRPQFANIDCEVSLTSVPVLSV